MTHLLLLHGALGHPGYFDFIKKGLAGRFVIHAPAFEGHAGTDLTVENLTMGTYVKQIREYCDRHALESVSIFGYSMGGYAGLCYAAMLPERVDAIMTLATKMDWSPEIAEQEVKMLKPDTIKEKVPKFADYLGSIHGADHWEKLVHAIARLLTDLGSKPLLDDTAYSAITARTQIMVGDQDTMVSIDETMEASRKIPDANFAVLPDTVHPFEKANRELILRLMEDFYRE